jgi:CubicO group peptidase (beta-lactamase class C family)
MENTCWFLSEMDITKHSKLYETRKFIKGWKEIPIYGLTTYPDGGVRTTINDLSNYLLCIMNNGSFKGNSIIQKSSVLEMLTPDFSGSYAKFWQAGKRIGHGGGDPGVSTRMYFDPGKKLGIIIFINTGSYDNFEELEDKVYEYGSSLLSQINNSKK